MHPESVLPLAPLAKHYESPQRRPTPYTLPWLSAKARCLRAGSCLKTGPARH